jgi:hypothetical protein
LYKAAGIFGFLAKERLNPLPAQISGACQPGDAAADNNRIIVIQQRMSPRR